MKTEFEWNEELGAATCVLIDDKQRIVVGHAQCHDDDRDMISERTGCEIAYRRARIEHLRMVREAELKPALQALKQLYYSMKHSSHFNPKSYENKMLQRQIRLFEFDLATTKEIIASEQRFLKEYIQGKDKVHNRIRKAKQNNEVISE